MTINDAISQAFDLLPENMRKDNARVLVHAIALQESAGIHRRQLVGSPPRPTGPAKSLWQGEIGGGMVHGVRTHAATRKHAAKLYEARGVEASDRAIWDAIENDDVLAAGLARLLLYSDPLPLPDVGDVERAWKTYLRTWRPGAYTRGTDAQKAALRKKWGENYACARQSSGL